MSWPVSPIVHVVGTRPNLVKAAPVVRALAELEVAQLVVHTGQHTDAALTSGLFADLGMAAPDVQLSAGRGGYARQLGRMMAGLESELARRRPPLVVIYGDVNSTLAAALVCAQLKLPIAHVEAGLRSFDPSMPEEVNRRVADLLSELLFTTVPEAPANLAAEGIDARRVHEAGNPMIDSLRYVESRLDPDAARTRFGLADEYAVATFHRPSNVDAADDAARVVAALADVARQIPVVLPHHPRGARTLARAGLARVLNLTVAPPLGYVEFLSLLRGARLVVTDSGGVQEETSALGIACLTVRSNTERPVTLSLGTNRLAEPAALGDAVSATLAVPPPSPANVPGWDGQAGPRIAEIVRAWLAT